jgi:hypothetical protein
LLSKGADPNGKDSKGITPFDLAEKAPNSVRSVLGLPPRLIPGSKSPSWPVISCLNDEKTQSNLDIMMYLFDFDSKEGMDEKKDKTGTVASTAFVPLPSTQLPLPPLQSPPQYGGVGGGSTSSQQQQQQQWQNLLGSPIQSLHGESSSLNFATDLLIPEGGKLTTHAQGGMGGGYSPLPSLVPPTSSSASSTPSIQHQHQQSSSSLHSALSIPPSLVTSPAQQLLPQNQHHQHHHHHVNSQFNVPQTIFYKLGDELDVVEIDLPIPSFGDLIFSIFSEFQLKPQLHQVIKIRKMPNILVRNDKDVARIRGGDVLQIVLSSNTSSPSSNTTTPAPSSSPF